MRRVYYIIPIVFCLSLLSSCLLVPDYHEYQGNNYFLTYEHSTISGLDEALNGSGSEATIFMEHNGSSVKIMIPTNNTDTTFTCTLQALSNKSFYRIYTYRYMPNGSLKYSPDSNEYLVSSSASKNYSFDIDSTHDGVIIEFVVFHETYGYSQTWKISDVHMSGIF